MRIFRNISVAQILENTLRRVSIYFSNSKRGLTWIKLSLQITFMINVLETRRKNIEVTITFFVLQYWLEKLSIEKREEGKGASGGIE